MKKALIFSDSHGRLDNLLEVLKRQRDFEAVFHMGDIMEDADRLRRATPYPVYLVRGNCDMMADCRYKLLQNSGERGSACAMATGI